MRHFLAFFLTATLALPAHAQMEVKSQFELLLSEPLFDRVITDFWGALQGTQEIAIPDLTVSPQGLPVYIQGVRAEVNYEFPLPKRTGAPAREWELSTEKLSARLFIDKIRASGRILRLYEGTRVWVNVDGACDNVVLSLPAGASHVTARVRAEVAENRVQLSLPAYEADWKPNSWRVDALRCSGIEGLEDVVMEEAKRALSTFKNFDKPVQEEIAARFKAWSDTASTVLFSQQELPTGRDYVRVTVQPETARETGHGLELSGQLNFVYPNLSPGRDVTVTHTLDGTGAHGEATEAGNLLLPFGLAGSLLRAQFEAGQLKFATDSQAVPGFGDFMQDRLAQAVTFPELRRYPVDASFGFDFAATAAPGLANARLSAARTIALDLKLPLSLRMNAPTENGLVPMVEFKNELTGPATLHLAEDGTVTLQAAPLATPVTYGWEQSYLATRNPNPYVAVDTFAGKLRTLVTEMGGVPLPFPALNVGTLSLTPNDWNLEGTNLRVHFAVRSSLEAAQTKAAKKRLMSAAARLRAASAR